MKRKRLKGKRLSIIIKVMLYLLALPMTNAEYELFVKNLVE